MDWMKRYEGMDISRVIGKVFTVKYRDYDGDETVRVGVMTVKDKSPCILFLDCGKDEMLPVFLCEDDTISGEFVGVEGVTPFFNNGAYKSIEKMVDLKSGDILLMGGGLYHATGEISPSRGTVKVQEDVGEVDFRLALDVLRYMEPPEEDGLYFDTEGRLWMKDLMWYRVDVDSHTLVEIPNSQPPGTLPLEPIDYTKWTKDWTRESSL